MQPAPVLMMKETKNLIMKSLKIEWCYLMRQYTVWVLDYHGDKKRHWFKDLQSAVNFYRKYA